MANENGGGKPIISVPIDTTDWDEFQTKFAKYRQALAEQPQAWKATNDEVRELAENFEAAAESFNKVVSAQRNADFGGGTTGSSSKRGGWASFTTATATMQSSKVTGPQSFISLFEKSSAKIDAYWKRVGENLAKSSKSMSTLFRSSTAGFSGLTALGGVGAVAAAAGAATVGATDDLSHKAVEAGQLGLKPGEADAFQEVFGTRGLGDKDLLAKIAQAKSNPAQWATLQAAGVPVSDIQSKDPAQLAQEFMESASQKFKSMPNGGLWASQLGITQFADVNSLRNASTYTPGQWAGLGHDYQQAAAKQSFDAPAALKNAQAFSESLNTIRTNMENTFNKVLGPTLVRFSGEVADWASGFAGDSKALTTTMQPLADAFTDVGRAAEWIKAKLNSVFGPITDDQQKHDVHLDKGGIAAEAVRFADHPLDTWRAWRAGTLTPAPAADYDFMWNHGSAGSTAAPAGAGGTPNSIDRTLDVIKSIESGGQADPAHAASAAGAQGAYQLLPSTAAQYGADPTDERQARAAARQEFMRDYRQFNDMRKALAAYDWGAGNVQKDVDRWGDRWADHLPPETRDYLRKAAARGLDLSAGLADPNDLQRMRTRTRSAEAQAAGVGSSASGTPEKPQKYPFELPAVPLRADIKINVLPVPGANVAVTAGQLPR